MNSCDDCWYCTACRRSHCREAGEECPDEPDGRIVEIAGTGVRWRTGVAR